MTLDHLQPRQRAIIVRLTGASSQRSRLLDLGLVPGADIALVRKAPISGGFQIEIKRSQLMLRQDLAASIEVKPL